LFIVNSAGVPSVARFVRVPVNQPPTAAISSPAANVTVQAGGSVSFAGSGNDPDGTVANYSWTFPGGSPAASSLAAPGLVTYATPGTYAASLTVTDNAGVASTPVIRTITVADFSLSATPTSQTVTAGGSATFTVGVTPSSGFTGTVTFSIAGLPSGATASFTPTTVQTSGSTSLKVTTNSSTPPGNYVLAISGSTGSLTHTANVTLAVTGDFSISVAPSSVTVPAGKDATYTVTIGAGFTGIVTLSVQGLPKITNARFAPSSIVNSGQSTLTVSPKKNAASGTSTLTITGTGGNASHSATATLVIQ
jgi:PKD domain